MSLQDNKSSCLLYLDASPEGDAPLALDRLVGGADVASIYLSADKRRSREAASARWYTRHERCLEGLNRTALEFRELVGLLEACQQTQIDVVTNGRDALS